MVVPFSPEPCRADEAAHYRASWRQPSGPASTVTVRGPEPSRAVVADEPVRHQSSGLRFSATRRTLRIFRRARAVSANRSHGALYTALYTAHEAVATLVRSVPVGINEVSRGGCRLECARRNRVQAGQAHGGGAGRTSAGG